MRRVCLLVLAAMTALPASAQLYQWRDAEGRVHYSDRPPADVEATVVRPGGVTAPAAPAASEAPKPKTMAEKELEFRERRAAAAEAEAKAAKEREQAAERERVCEDARGKLAALNSGQRLVRFNSQGEREYIDDATRAAEVERTQKFLDSTCK